MTEPVRWITQAGDFNAKNTTKVKTVLTEFDAK